MLDGIVAGLDNSQSGHAAEHLVAYDLARRGFRVLQNPYERAPYDVLADIGGAFLRVQVKSTRGLLKKCGNYYSYRFSLECGDYSKVDLIALVALDTQSIIYMPVKDVRGRRMLWVSPRNMTAGCTKALDSLHTCEGGDPNGSKG